MPDGPHMHSGQQGMQKMHISANCAKCGEVYGGGSGEGGCPSCGGPLPDIDPADVLGGTDDRGAVMPAQPPGLGELGHEESGARAGLEQAKCEWYDPRGWGWWKKANKYLRNLVKGIRTLFPGWGGNYGDLFDRISKFCGPIISAIETKEKLDEAGDAQAQFKQWCQNKAYEAGGIGPGDAFWLAVYRKCINDGLSKAVDEGWKLK